MSVVVGRSSRSTSDWLLGSLFGNRRQRYQSSEDLDDRNSSSIKAQPPPKPRRMSLFAAPTTDPWVLLQQKLLEQVKGGTAIPTLCTYFTPLEIDIIDEEAVLTGAKALGLTQFTLTDSKKILKKVQRTNRQQMTDSLTVSRDVFFLAFDIIINSDAAFMSRTLSFSSTKRVQHATNYVEENLHSAAVGDPIKDKLRNKIEPFLQSLLPQIAKQAALEAIERKKPPVGLTKGTSFLIRNSLQGLSRAFSRAKIDPHANMASKAIEDFLKDSKYLREYMHMIKKQVVISSDMEGKQDVLTVEEFRDVFVEGLSMLTIDDKDVNMLIDAFQFKPPLDGNSNQQHFDTKQNDVLTNNAQNSGSSGSSKEKAVIHFEEFLDFWVSIVYSAGDSSSTLQASSGSERKVPFTSHQIDDVIIAIRKQIAQDLGIHFHSGAHLKRLFITLDINANQSIEKDEFQHVMKTKYQLILSRYDIDHLYEKVAGSEGNYGDGQSMSYVDFLTLLDIPRYQIPSTSSS